jgi:hypothetical protein
MTDGTDNDRREARRTAAVALADVRWIGQQPRDMALLRKLADASVSGGRVGQR